MSGRPPESDGERDEHADRKSTLRREIRGALGRMSTDERRAAAAAARARIVEIIERSQADAVLAYLSDGLEVDLDPTIELLLDRGCTIAVPVVLPERGRMTPVRITGLDPSAFVRDRYDLRSPRPPHEIVDLDRLDLVVVPGVAFTTDGHRLGRGGGYYDRLLADLPGRVRRAGICHAGQVVPSLPIESHDAEVDDLIVV
jgi:5-formyltetrahydrofolate cyclo-ligase